MSRDPDAIQRDIEKAREALANTLDEIGTKAHPKRFVDSGKATVQDKLNDPKVRYTLIGVGALLAAALLRKLFR